MNYIAHLNGYRKRRKTEPLSTNEIALYFILLEYCNEIGWVEWFNVPNSILEGLSGLSRSAFHRARGELVRLGYIRYREGKGNHSGRYLIVDFGTQSETQSGTQSETQMRRKVEPLNKLKQKQKESPPNPLTGESPDSGKPEKKQRSSEKEQLRQELYAVVDQQTANEAVRQAAKDWLDMRLQMRNKLLPTPRAVEIAFETVRGFGYSDPEKAANCFKQSVLKGYTGIWDPKGG